MVLPNKFQTESSINVNYSYTDILAKSGYLTVYPCAAQTNSTTTYFTTVRPYNSVPRSTAFNQSASTGNILVIDIDFDYTFNVPQIVKGDLINNFTDIVYNSDAGCTTTTYWVVNIYKVNLASAESLLVSQQTISTGRTGTTFYSVNRYCLKMPISETNFGVGEKIRINFLGYLTKSSSSGVGILTLNHDPKNVYTYFGGSSTSGAPFSPVFTGDLGSDSNILIDIPFKIDL